jgi:hypothetical protein
MRRSIASLVLIGLAVAACGQPAASPGDGAEEPAIVELVAGQESIHRITLSQRALERLGIETAEVLAAPGAGGQTHVPYSAVIYDAAGEAWAYIVDGAPNVFVRHALTVDEIVTHQAGDYAVLTSGPQAGLSVVSVGVAELFGAEFSVGH